MNAHFPDNILTALKEAIINVFWKKKDVRALFQRCGVDSTLVAAQDWNAFKFHIVSPVVDALNGNAEGIGPLRRILQETLAYTDGNHLLWLPDGQKRKREAERSLEHLRLLVKDHDAAKQSAEEARQARLRRVEEANSGALFRSKLSDVQNRFVKLCQDADHRKRGYGLEELLYDLFLLFELSPRGAFKRTGEQIDGAFVLAGDHYLLEAKWQEKPVNLGDLRDLDGAVGSSLDNTLGLFISINDFSPEAIESYSQGSRPRLICMDGADMIAVLECRIELPDLLLRKKDFAVQKRRVFVRAGEILKG
ncbi:MAG: restriction endonuclease [Terriglobia bacterium]